MASNLNLILLQCAGCQRELSLDSKTFSCLHSFCLACFKKCLKAETNLKCPECQEVELNDKLTLLPILARSLERQKLSLTDLKCDFCSEDGIESTATEFCQFCQNLICESCSRCHKKLNPNHISIKLNTMRKSVVIKTMLRDECIMHHKANDFYCGQCNVCICETCYEKDHSLVCSSEPLSVKAEALKNESRISNLSKEISRLQIHLKKSKEKKMDCIEKLNTNCNLKCTEIWAGFEKITELAKQKTQKLCEETKKLTERQINRWENLTMKTDQTVKQLQTLMLYLDYFSMDEHENGDIVSGLKQFESRLSNLKEEALEMEPHLEIIFENWWLKTMEQMKTEKIGFVSLMIFDKQLDLHGSNFSIDSIYINKDDDHIFLCDLISKSVIELTEFDEIVNDCKIIDENNDLSPIDICSISADIFLVSCFWKNRIIFLERNKNPSSIKIQKVVKTEKEIVSLCKVDELIFACDRNFRINCFTNEWKHVKSFEFDEEKENVYCPLIRSDPSSGHFWGTKMFSSKVFCFDKSGKVIDSIETKESFSDFCLDEFGDLYFCNDERVFSLSSSKIDFKLEKKSESYPRIFVAKNKIYLCLQNDEKWLIKIFKIIE